MLGRSRSTYVVGVVSAGLGVLVMVAGCMPQQQPDPNATTPPPGPTTLVSRTDPGLPLNFTFNPTSAGKTITVNITGNASGSRIQVTVTDFFLANVIPTSTSATNSFTASFTSSGTGVHIFNAVETAVPSSLYTTTITQSP